MQIFELFQNSFLCIGLLKIGVILFFFKKRKCWF